MNRENHDQARGRAWRETGAAKRQGVGPATRGEAVVLQYKDSGSNAGSATTQLDALGKFALPYGSVSLSAE